jgi:hypothetical protein
MCVQCQVNLRLYLRGRRCITGEYRLDLGIAEDILHEQDGKLGELLHQVVVTLASDGNLHTSCFQISDCTVVDTERCVQVQQAKEHAGIEQAARHQGGGHVAFLEAWEELGGDGAVRQSS